MKGRTGQRKGKRGTGRDRREHEREGRQGELEELDRWGGNGMWGRRINKEGGDGEIGCERGALIWNCPALRELSLQGTMCSKVNNVRFDLTTDEIKTLSEDIKKKYVPLCKLAACARLTTCWQDDPGGRRGRERGGKEDVRKHHRSTRQDGPRA
eukprot:766057-Hanusia_phi.AAC.2